MSEEAERDADEPAGEGEAVPQAPALRVVSGSPSAEELAALVAVVASLGGEAHAPARPRPQWSAPHRLQRRTFPSGQCGWRASGLPR